MKPMLYQTCVSFGSSFYPRPVERGLLRISEAFRSWNRRDALPMKWECVGGGSRALGNTRDEAWQKWAMRQDLVERQVARMTATEVLANQRPRT